VLWKDPFSRSPPGMEEEINIGLFGGSFDPIHNGHLLLARWTKNELALDRVIFIPAAIPPHKQHVLLTDANHRFRMVQIAVEPYPDFEASDIELRRAGVSYTIDTVLYFKKKLKLHRRNLYLIIGADSLVDFGNWKSPEKIVANCQLAVLQRPDVDIDRAEPIFRQSAILLQSPLIDISATEIRRRVKMGLPIAELVPPAVERYIHELGLYR